MDMDTFILNNFNTYNEVISSYDDIKDIYDETSKDVISIFVTSLEDKVLIDTDTLNYIVYLLQNIYTNSLALLFIVSCLSSVYVCTYRRKKDFVLLNNIEPKLLKGELIEKI